MDTKQFIAEHLHDDVHELALKYRNAEVDMALALRQITARQLLLKKVPSWSGNDDLLFPAHLSIEQCSSEAAARYKATLLQGDRFADLTGGLGVDCHFIAQQFHQADYVEQNAELCALAEHNFKILSGTAIRIVNESAEAYVSHCSPVDCFFLDPARRDAHGRKTVSIADCTPNLLAFQDQLLDKAPRVLVKLSPMLDLSQALGQLRPVSQVHVVAVANECKELLFLLEADYQGAPIFSCVNLLTGQPVVRFTREEETACQPVFANEPSSYLYEPHAALLKAGCFKLLTHRFGVRKLHRNSHLYTSETLVAGFPGRVFKVEGWAPFNKTVRQTLLSGVDQASIATRNFPLGVAELRKALRIADGDAVYLFATQLVGDRKVIIKTTKAIAE